MSFYYISEIQECFLPRCSW